MSLMPSFLMCVNARSRFTILCAVTFGAFSYPLIFLFVRFSSSLISNVPSLKSTLRSLTAGPEKLALEPLNRSLNQLVNVSSCQKNCKSRYYYCLHCVYAYKRYQNLGIQSCNLYSFNCDIHTCAHKHNYLHSHPVVRVHIVMRFSGKEVDVAERVRIAPRWKSWGTPYCRQACRTASAGHRRVALDGYLGTLGKGCDCSNKNGWGSHPCVQL